MNADFAEYALYLLCSVIVGYFLGCSNMAYYVGKVTGVDLRSGGSRNLGASNAWIMIGWPAAIIVGAHDIGKAVLAVWLAKTLAVPIIGQNVPLAGIIAGVACILGHIYPFYLNFKGGKGTAAFVGVSFATHWMLGCTAVLLIVVCTLLTRYIVVGTVSTIVSVPILAGILLKTWTIPAILLVATCVIMWKHRKNLVRIYKGTEIPLYGKKPTQQQVDEDM